MVVLELGDLHHFENREQVRSSNVHHIPHRITPPGRPYHLLYQACRHSAVLTCKSRRRREYALKLTQCPLEGPAPLRSSAAEAWNTKPDRTETSRRQTFFSALSGTIAPTLCRRMRQPRQFALLGCIFGALDAVSCSFGVCLEWRDSDQSLLAFRVLACQRARRSLSRAKCAGDVEEKRGCGG